MHLIGLGAFMLIPRTLLLDSQASSVVYCTYFSSRWWCFPPCLGSAPISWQLWNIRTSSFDAEKCYPLLLPGHTSGVMPALRFPAGRKQFPVTGKPCKLHVSAFASSTICDLQGRNGSAHFRLALSLMFQAQCNHISGRAQQVHMMHVNTMMWMKATE